MYVGVNLRSISDTSNIRNFNQELVTHLHLFIIITIIITDIIINIIIIFIHSKYFSVSDWLKSES